MAAALSLSPAARLRERAESGSGTCAEAAATSYRCGGVLVIAIDPGQDRSQPPVEPGGAARGGHLHLFAGSFPSRQMADMVPTSIVLGIPVMPRRLDNARHWRARAEEARDLAEQLANPEAKRIMLGIAVSYVALAQMAAERDTARRGP